MEDALKNQQQASGRQVTVPEEVQEDQPLGNRRRRLTSAVEDLPEPLPTSRPRRSESEAASRHLDALRRRLDRLVRREEKFGEEQRGLHDNRAERNALIFALQQLAPEAIRLAAAPAQPRQHDPAYVRFVDQRIDEAIAAGFTVSDLGRPGVLRHRSGEDIAAVNVPLSVWFGVRHHILGRESK